MSSTYVGVATLVKHIMRNTTQKKLKKRMAVKPFVKAVNLNHMMPTRYSLDVSDKLKALVSDDTLSSEEKHAAALKRVKKVMDDRYKNIAVAKNTKAAMGAAYFYQVGSLCCFAPPPLSTRPS